MKDTVRTSGVVFISHSGQDQRPYTSLCLALESEQISHWDPRVMRSGDSLKGQLKHAIASCDLCVYLLTRSSVESKWCLAETGAFWGAGKRIILYKANPDISDDAFPPLFLGDLWICDVREILSQVKEELAKNAEGANLTGGPVRSKSSWHSDGRDSNPPLTKDEIVAILQGWLGHRPEDSNTSVPIFFAEVDKELDLPPGTASKHIEEAGSEWYFVKRKGPTLIQFAPRPFVYQSPIPEIW